MSEETKFLLSELNKIFNKNYNLLSFDNITKEELLQILCDTLTHLDAMPSIVVQKSSEQAIVTILEVLQNIKYSPAKNVTPEEFREGLALGKHTIICPILYWLLSNSQQVKKRAYLAKYVEKIDCPIEMLNDPDINAMRMQYENLIEEFWKTYSDSQKEKKKACEAKELQNDITKMESDITRLQQRIEQQKQKVENIPNKEVLLAIVKAYRNEMNEQKKLEEQLVEQEHLNAQIENEVMDLKNKLSYKKSRNPGGLEPMQQILNELHTNKILENQLPDELKLIKKKYELYENIIRGPEITMQEINELNQELTKEASEIQKLLEQKKALNNNTDGELGPFRNQAAIIANKKQEVSNAVMELKGKINAIYNEISEKEEVLATIVGGPLLQGDNLKKYVVKLRESNVVYKEYKSQLRNLTTEQNVLTRTIDILKSIDPSIHGILQNLNKNKHDQEHVPNDTTELKREITKIAAETDQVRAETAQIREELKTYTAEIQPIITEYGHLKENFEEVTEPATNKLKQINDDILLLQDQIKECEDKWKLRKLENERKESLLQRLNEHDATSNLDNKQPTYVNTLQQKLVEKEKLKNKLEKESTYLENQKIDAQRNLEILQRIIYLLQAKDDNVPY